jgi:hypothetical protein
MALRPAAAAALAVLAAAPGACARGLEPAGRFTWATAAVTELSAIEVAGNGLDFVAVSDRGWLLRGRFDRQDGRIAGVQVGTLAPILGNDGLPVAARRVGDWADAEGLAVAADGSCWVSFERWAHVARYDGCTGAGQWIRDHPDFAALADNRQLEALAVDAQGVLYTLPEEPPEASRDGGFTLWRLDPAGWAVAGQVPQADGFAVVGADFDDAGRLYLLERKLAMGLWWQSRVRRLRVAAPGDTETLRPEILWTGGQGEHGNLEGLSVWRDGPALRLTLVSDDNGDPDEPTQFVEFRLEEAP